MSSDEKDMEKVPDTEEYVTLLLDKKLLKLFKSQPSQLYKIKMYEMQIGRAKNIFKAVALELVSLC